MAATSKQQNHVSNLVAQGSALISQIIGLQALFDEAILLGYIARDSQTGVVTCNLPDDAFQGANSFLTPASIATTYQGLAQLNDSIVANNGQIMADVLTIKP